MKKRLYKIKSEKQIAGVAAGLAEYFDIDKTLVRVLLAIGIFTPVPVITAYILCWIIMPDKSSITISVNS